MYWRDPLETRTRAQLWLAGRAALSADAEGGYSSSAQM